MNKTFPEKHKKYILLYIKHIYYYIQNIHITIYKIHILYKTKDACIKSSTIAYNLMVIIRKDFEVSFKLLKYYEPRIA